MAVRPCSIFSLGLFLGAAAYAAPRPTSDVVLSHVDTAVDVQQQAVAPGSKLARRLATRQRRSAEELPNSTGVDVVSTHSVEQQEPTIQAHEEPAHTSEKNASFKVSHKLPDWYGTKPRQEQTNHSSGNVTAWEALKWGGSAGQSDRESKQVVRGAEQNAEHATWRNEKNSTQPSWNANSSGTSKETFWRYLSAKENRSNQSMPIAGSQGGNQTHARKTATAPLIRQKAKHASASSQGPKKAVVHMLFMLKDWLPHAETWKSFLDGAQPGELHSYVHCQDIKTCTDTGLFKVLPNLRPVPTADSWYCHDLVSAMVRLLSVSLATGNAAPGTREKFVFVSDSTLPLKPFEEVRDALGESPDSDFCFFPWEQWASADIEGRKVVLAKHHQWVILNREHAEKMVEKWRPVEANGFWSVPLYDAHWTKGQTYTPHHFRRSAHANWCADEWAFFATIFGAVETNVTSDATVTLAGLSSGALHTWGPEASVTQGRCRTFSFWGDAGEDFAALSARIAGDHDGSALSCYPKCFNHPAVFQQVSDISLESLRESPFLFARKFEQFLQIPNFEAIVLAPRSQSVTMKPQVVPTVQVVEQPQSTSPLIDMNTSAYHFVALGSP